jgi:predicted HTH domain antitoxin
MRGEQQMKSLNIPIPESLLLEPAATLHDLRREAQLVLALHYFDAGRLSCGQAASMAGLGKVAFLREASARGIPVLRLDDEELAAEMHALASDPYLEARAKRADGRGWKLLDDAPDAPPLPADEMVAIGREAS